MNNQTCKHPASDESIDITSNPDVLPYDEDKLLKTFLSCLEDFNPQSSRLTTASTDFATMLNAIKNHDFIEARWFPSLDNKGDDKFSVLKIFEKYLGISDSPESIPCYKETRDAMRLTTPKRDISIADEITAIYFLASIIAHNIAMHDEDSDLKESTKSVATIITDILSKPRINTMCYKSPNSRENSLVALAYLISIRKDCKLNVQMALEFKYDKAYFESAVAFMMLAGIIGMVLSRDDYATHIINLMKMNMDTNPRAFTDDEMEMIKNYLPVRLQPSVAKELTSEEIWEKENVVKYASYLFKDKEKYIDEEIVDITYTKTTQKTIDKVNQLRKKHPNFAKVIDFVEKNLKLALITKQPFKIPPVCLRGPSGTGKTVFANALSGCLEIPKLSIHANQITCGSILTGLQRTWGTGTQGLITKIIQDCQKINPIVIVDEFSIMLDRAYQHNGIAPVAALLNLLDPNEAKNFVDGYSREEIDLSHVSWIFATNHLNGISEPLRKRLHIFDIAPPSASDADVIAKNIFIDAICELSLETKIDAQLSDIGLQIIIERVKDKEDFRTIKNEIKDAILEFAMENLEHFEVQDCDKLSMPPRCLQTKRKPSII